MTLVRANAKTLLSSVCLDKRSGTGVGLMGKQNRAKKKLIDSCRNEQKRLSDGFIIDIRLEGIGNRALAPYISIEHSGDTPGNC